MKQPQRFLYAAEVIYEGLEVLHIVGEEKTDVHNGRAREGHAKLADLVLCVLVKTARMNALVLIVADAKGAEGGDDCLALVLSNHRHTEVVGGVRIVHAVKVTEEDEVLHFLECGNLTADSLSFLLCHLLSVELIARRTEVRDVGTRVKGRDSSRLVVGADGGVAGLGRKGIDHRRAVLDAGAHIGIGIVARPDLRPILNISV